MVNKLSTSGYGSKQTLFIRFSQRMQSPVFFRSKCSNLLSCSSLLICHASNKQIMTHLLNVTK